NERGLYFSERSLALSGAKPSKIHLAHVVGAHSLRREGTEAALQAGRYLPLQQRLGYRELIAFDQLLDQLIFGRVLHVMLFLGFDLLANASAQLIDALEIAQFPRKLVVQFWNLLFLDRFDL